MDSETTSAPMTLEFKKQQDPTLPPAPPKPNSKKHRNKYTTAPTGRTRSGRMQKDMVDQLVNMEFRAKQQDEVISKLRDALHKIEAWDFSNWEACDDVSEAQSTAREALRV